MGSLYSDVSYRNIYGLAMGVFCFRCFRKGGSVFFGRQIVFFYRGCFVDMVDTWQVKVNVFVREGFFVGVYQFYGQILYVCIEREKVEFGVLDKIIGVCLIWCLKDWFRLCY